MSDHLARRLDENDRLAEEATEGPLVRYSVDFRGQRSHSVKSLSSGAVRAHTGYGPDGGSAYADAELFAHSRSELPALNRAVRAVLALHRPDVRTARMRYYCAHCGDDAAWPCPTVQAICDAMGEE